MAKKAQRYSNSSGFGTFIMIFMVIFIVGAGYLFFTGILSVPLMMSWAGYTKSPTAISKDTFKPQSLSTLIETPTCKPQSIQVSSDENKPISIVRVGWDNAMSCCADIYSGFTCGIEQKQDIVLCRSSDLGGEIIYIQKDNIFLEQNVGLSMINSLRKNSIC